MADSGDSDFSFVVSAEKEKEVTLTGNEEPLLIQKAGFFFYSKYTMGSSVQVSENV
ncbi:MAG: hypothetical protein WC401_12940 [Bacteroidales bacterium]